MNRKRVILGVLLGILTVCLVYAYLATPRLEKAPPRVPGPGKQTVNQRAPQQDEMGSSSRIDFTYLSSDVQEYTGAQRDIFRFKQRRPPKTAPPPTRIVKKEPVKPLFPPKAVPVEVMQKSLSQFTFLGFLEKAGEKTVFLSSGGNLFLVKQGEHFGVNQEFLVEQIDDNLLKVSHAGREGLIEIKLIEKQKLNAAVSAPASAAVRAPVSLSPNAGSVGGTVNNRSFSPQRRFMRSVVRQEDQGFQDDVNQEDQSFQDDTRQEDQDFQDDDNSWPAERRQGLTELDGNE